MRSRRKLNTPDLLSPNETNLVTNEFVIKGLSAGVRTTGEPFRSRSMVFCLAGHHAILSMGGNAQRRGLKTSFVLLCPRSPGLTPRSLLGYLFLNS